MRWATRGFIWLLFCSPLGGCDTLWAAYIVDTPLCDPDDPTLVLCLNFSGATIDGSRNQIPITGGPGPTYGPGVIGQAAHFDTTTPTVNMGDNPAWQVSEFSFESWVRPQQAPTGTNKRFGIIDREGGASVFLYAKQGQSFLELRCAIGTIGSDLNSFGLMIPQSTFSHIACTVKSGEQSFYFNGQPVSHNTVAYQPRLAPVPTIQQLGSNAGGGEPDSLVGELDELRFFSQARTADQIQAAYQRGVLPGD